MNSLIILVGMSLIAIAFIYWLVQKLYPVNNEVIIDQKSFQSALLAHRNEQEIETVYASNDSKGAIARLKNSSKLALIRELGDRSAIRIVTPGQLKMRQDKAGKTHISINDFTWPAMQFDAETASHLCGPQFDGKEL